MPSGNPQGFAPILARVLGIYTIWIDQGSDLLSQY